MLGTYRNHGVASQQTKGQLIKAPPTCVRWLVRSTWVSILAAALLKEVARV